jgi:hypothetical protein
MEYPFAHFALPELRATLCARADPRCHQGYSSSGQIGGSNESGGGEVARIGLRRLINVKSAVGQMLLFGRTKWLAGVPFNSGPHALASRRLRKSVKVRVMLFEETPQAIDFNTAFVPRRTPTLVV